MGKRGPAPKPTSLRILHGEQKSRINTNEPKPAEGIPNPPIELEPDVREIWDYTVEQLRHMGTITLADRDTLYAYCQAVAVHQRVSRELATGELLSTGMRLGLVKNPLIGMQRDAAALLRSLAREFGLTPSSRSEINLGRVKDAGGPERLLSQ